MNNLQILSIFSKKCHPQCVWARDVIPYFKWSVLNNGQLEFTFLSYFKPPVLNNGQLEFTFFILFQAASPKQRTAWVYHFILFQAASPKQRTAWVYPSSCFKGSVPTDEQFEITFYFLESVIPSMSGREVSLKSFVSIKLSFQIDTIVHNHFPQWNYSIP